MNPYNWNRPWDKADPIQRIPELGQRPWMGQPQQPSYPARPPYQPRAVGGTPNTGGGFPAGYPWWQAQPRQAEWPNQQTFNPLPPGLGYGEVNPPFPMAPTMPPPSGTGVPWKNNPYYPGGPGTPQRFIDRPPGQTPFNPIRQAYNPGWGMPNGYGTWLNQLYGGGWNQGFGG